MKITLGFSPCPNDTFIFDALVNNKIDTGDLEFEVVLEDVQTLNDWAKKGKLDISKISYGVLPLVLNEYVLLSSGGALGKGVGPLLITNKPGILSEAEVNTSLIAIPGENTTAHMLFSLAYPEAANKKFMIFNQVEDALLQDKANAGVIIHENRFTYQARGLRKVVDLGEYWESATGHPIPLGGIVVRCGGFPVLVRRRLGGFEAVRLGVGAGGARLKRRHGAKHQNGGSNERRGQAHGAWPTGRPCCRPPGRCGR